jgi:hypothetical protein
MPVAIKKPKNKLKYTPTAKIAYKTTSFRLPVAQLKDLKEWADEYSDETNDGSLNNLVQRILDWGLENKESRK